MPKSAIAQFLTDPSSGDFDSLAREAFAWQYERIPAYRALCEGRGVRPGSFSDWREIPMVPTSAFRTVALHADPAVETFRSSGTTGGDSADGAGRSVHHHPYPELYRLTIDATFPRACLEGPQPAMLSLIPDREQLPDSSLSFMVDHVLKRLCGEASRYAFGTRGLDFPAARSWLSARQRDRQPSLILATAFSLAQLLDRLGRLGLRFRLPPGTVLFETGGFKGRHRELSRDELLTAATEFLAIEPGRVVREYGMTELTSQLYTQALHGGDPDLFLPPHWVRARVLDPESLKEAPSGQPGLVALFDLANLGSAVHLLTEDLGVAEAEGFRLIGRAAGAQLRGCSLTAEELERGAEAG